MKRSLAIWIAVILMVSSCTFVPVIPSAIPPDPEDVSEPTIWSVDVNMTMSLDTSSFVTPLDVPKYTRIRLSFIGYNPPSEVDAGNFQVFEDGRAQGFVLSRASEIVKRIDIVFVVDVTGSMGSAISGVKSSLVNFLDYLKSSGQDVAVAVMPFDDKAPAGGEDSPTYDPPWLNLTSDIDSAQDYVNGLNASGGNDWPENAYGAIEYAWENASWRGGARRIFILITDAPSHYEGESGAEPFDPVSSKGEILGLISGRATLYMVAVTGGYYHESDTDFSSPGDPREIAVETGGAVIYQDPYEEVDLTELGIAESVLNTFYITFQSDSPGPEHTVSVYYEGPDGVKSAKSITVEY